jgi:pimeloyl-ACP methyl ester carboxylesterase
MNLRLVGYCPLAFCVVFGLAGANVAMHGQANPKPEISAAASPSQLPRPSGRFGIGRVGCDWVDRSRMDRFTPGAPRELMAYMWYPTDKKYRDHKGVYLPGAKQMDATPEIQRSMREEFESSWPLIVSGAIFSHALENAPIAKAPKQFPVIVFSHGAGSSGFEYTALLEELVSHGYVVAAIEHTETAAAVMFPDGRLAPFHRDAPAAGLSDAERFKRMMESATAGINEGAADVRFVLDRLAALNAGDSRDFLLARRLDLGRAVAMGHSAGAEFAVLACELDARFKACVDLDGGMVPVAALPEAPNGAKLTQPLLFLEAYHPESQMGGSHEQHVEYFKKREEQLRECPTGTYAVVLRSRGMMHGSFSDYFVLAAATRPDQMRPALHNLSLVEEFVVAFLDKSLNGAAGAILKGSAGHATEAEVQSYGR